MTAHRESESIERQYVRYAYADDCQLPYLSATDEAAQAEQRRKSYRYTQPPINRVLAALLAAGCTYRASTSDVDSWGAECPTHDDTQPSLNVRRNHDGTVWLKCWAGCSKEGILAALGLEWRDLWDASEHDTGRAKPRLAPLLTPHLRRAMEDILRRDDERNAA